MVGKNSEGCCCKGTLERQPGWFLSQWFQWDRGHWDIKVLAKAQGKAFCYSNMNSSQPAHQGIYYYSNELWTSHQFSNWIQVVIIWNPKFNTYRAIGYCLDFLNNDSGILGFV